MTNEAKTEDKTVKKATVKKATIKRVVLKIDLKKDFSETLEITRTLFKNKISKTSIVEASLCCASAQSTAFTVTQIATFIITNLNVSDCFHKRESNKSNDLLKSTILRVRHHIVDTIKTHHKADKLYSYIKSSDSVEFSDMYHKFCKTDRLYRRRVSALIAKIKLQYAVKTVKTVKQSAKADKSAKNTKTVKHIKQSVDINAVKALIAA